MGGNKWEGGTEEVDQDDQVIRSQGCQLGLVVVMCEDLLKLSARTMYNTNILDKVRSQKKERYYLGIFPKRRTPPPPPPFWEPLIQKKFLVFILHFRT